MTRHALKGAEIFDGRVLQSGKVLLLEDGILRGIVGPEAVPEGYRAVPVAGGTLMPGFVDLQVNGGGGVMFNDETTLDGLAAIAEAHAGTGTRGFLPTLITDTPGRTRDAVTAVEAAIARGVPGILGLHLEGPHLSLARKGAHDPALIRPMQDADEAFLCDAARRLPNLMVTVAPEAVPPGRIARLARAGVIVSLGHSDCSMAEARTAFAAGARCVTHLFNAMSQMGNREPGLVGAALCDGGVSAGLIADGIHVHEVSMRAALRAKRGPGAIFLVTDAMSPVGSGITEFRLNSRRVLRRENRLTLEDGTLAGADLTLPAAVAVLTERVGLSRAEALAMTTSAPARLLRRSMGRGRLETGAEWTGIRLDRSLRYDRAFDAAAGFS